MATKNDFTDIKKLVDNAKHAVVIQAENPDGDSLGSALALEAILSDLDKKVSLYCAVDMPKYLHYASGWDRVQTELPRDFDLSIIVDTASHALLQKALAHPNLGQITKYPVIVIDHHTTQSDIPFKTTLVSDASAVATSEIIFDIAQALDWPLPADACNALALSIMADSLGLASEGTTAKSIYTLASLVERGASLSSIETARRELMRKPPSILEYKGKLLQRIEYFLDGSLALIHIPWSEIEEHSDLYNPPVLVLDEMRLVEKVRLAVALKSYPDGKITGKLRANPDAQVAEAIAGFFGGGGHPYAAGFKVYGDSLDVIKNELIGAVDKALQENDRKLEK